MLAPRPPATVTDASRRPPAGRDGISAPVERHLSVSDAARQRAPTTASNRRAAIADARRLLGGVVAPPRSTLRFSGMAIGPSRHTFMGALASVVAYRSWLVRQTPSRALSFAQAHLPPGSMVISTASGGPRFVRSVIRSWPPVAGRLDGRWLKLRVTATARGATILYAAAQSQWVVVRLRTERIPAGVRRVLITERLPGRPPLLVGRVTSRPKVHALVRLFDALAVVQPVVINCPAAPSSVPTVVVVFLSGARRQLARASVSAAADFSWPASAAWMGLLPGRLQRPRASLQAAGRQRDLTDPAPFAPQAWTLTTTARVSLEAAERERVVAAPCAWQQVTLAVGRRGGLRLRTARFGRFGICSPSLGGRPTVTPVRARL
jgi:hypothetical protein